MQKAVIRNHKIKVELGKMSSGVNHIYICAEWSAHNLWAVCYCVNDQVILNHYFVSQGGRF